MKRKELIEEARRRQFRCDVLVIGGGATGLGTAVDAASRGYRTILLEQNDFAKATSSRSTKLVHGGVRYLAQGDVQMVIGALHERGRMRRNAPHLVHDMRFIIGNYRWWEQPFYTIGLTLYDILAGRLGLGRSLPLSRRTVRKELPGIKQEGLKGGVVYHDGQFDDARMAITLAQTLADLGGICLNYVKVTGLCKDGNGRICGVMAEDLLSGEHYTVSARLVVNATGVFADDIMRMDTPGTGKKIRPSQGVHLVVDGSFLGGNSALMIPKTKDGRVLFGVPWHGKAVLGTTDTPLDEETLEPRALDSEVDFILDQAGQYLEKKPTRADVLSVFAGLRPLAAPTHNDSKKTKEISRNHKIYKSRSGLLTITGGKWTTYREMAEDAIDIGMEMAGLPRRKCVTKDLKVHGYAKPTGDTSWNYVYGSDAEHIRQIIRETPEYGQPLHPGYSFTGAHVAWAVREEMAETVEDVLARRVRALFLDARAAIDMAPAVAAIMAREAGKDEAWQQEQVRQFVELAGGYLLCPYTPGNGKPAKDTPDTCAVEPGHDKRNGSAGNAGLSRVEKALKAASDTKDLRIGNGIISETGRLFKEQFPGKTAVIVADTTTFEVAGHQVEQALKDAGVEQLAPFIFEADGLYAEYSYVDRLSVFLKEASGNADVVPIAVGSGTINDLTKLSSHLTGRRYMTVATAASMDGYTAFGASITADGAKQTFSCPAPQAVLADIGIIRQAPVQMTASGYADLFAKVTAGADWILADSMGVEPIDGQAWSIVQDGLKDALADPEGARRGDVHAIEQLTEGLMLGGFAMQWAKSSRPASGAEHQFSHLWNMEHHLNNGHTVSHGFQVSIGMLAVTAFYGQVLDTPFDKLDVEACCDRWPSDEEIEARARRMFEHTDFPDIGIRETRAKAVTRQELAAQLQRLKDRWPEIRQRLSDQLVPFKEAKRRLKLVGAPTEPEEIGISRQRLRDSFVRAQYIRRRFTVLDLAIRTGYMESWLDALFGKGGIWETEG